MPSQNLKSAGALERATMEPVFILFALGIAAVIALAWWLSHQHRKALAAVAAQLGLEFAPGGRRLDKELRDFDAMRAGSAPRIVNEMRGRYKERNVRVFDFEYTVQNGKHTSTRHRGVMLCEVPRAWRDLRIVPEHLGHKLLDAVGMDDIDFESQEFSDRFWVRSTDRKFAYDVIDPRMMEFLLAPGPARWEIRDGILCMWGERRWRPADIVPGLDRLVGFVERVPRHVWTVNA